MLGTLRAGLLASPHFRRSRGRDHLLLICGDDSWEGHLWAARLRGPLTWFRSAVSEFPLLGVQRHSAAAFVTPRPHRREEVLVFGGVIGRDIVDIFMTLDTRTWEETEAVLPQERWKEVEARLKAKGLEEHEINQHKTDWQVRAATRCQLPHLEGGRHHVHCVLHRTFPKDGEHSVVD